MGRMPERASAMVPPATTFNRRNSMTIAASLMQYAQDIALQQEQRASAIQQEILKLEEQLLQKQAAMNSCRLAAQRLSNFVPQVGANYYCPRCFIEHELVTALDPIG